MASLVRLSDLRDKRIETSDGKRMGRVHEVHCDKGRVVAIICGPGSLIERWTGRSKGRRIPWEYVREIEAHRIIVEPDPPRRVVRKGSGSRNPKGTRRPSAPRSKR